MQRALYAVGQSKLLCFDGRFSEASLPNVENRPGLAKGEYNKSKPMSLKEATSSEPVFFQAKANHDREQQKKKEVNRDEVRQALSEAVSQIQRQSATREKKEGVIHPGETISL